MTKNQALNAEVYQALHTGTFGDWQFYKSLVKTKSEARQKCSEPLSVLELGCGSGRILCELAEFPVNLTGLELNQDLLDLCHQNMDQRSLEAAININCKLELILGDFSELSILFQSRDGKPANYDLIIIPYNGLYCLLSEAAQSKLIREALHLLSSDGELWFDGYALPDPEEYEYESAEDYSPLTVIELQSSSSRRERILGIEELDYFQQEKQWFTASYRLKAPDDEVTLEPLHGLIEQIQHRYLYPWQLPKLCQNAGGKLHRLTADFGGEDIALNQDIRSACEWGIEAEHWVACVKK